MKAGELYWSIEPIALYADRSVAYWDYGSNPINRFDGPLRCQTLASFHKTPVYYLPEATFFLVVDTSYEIEEHFCVIEVISGDKRGWIVKRDFQFLNLVS